MFSSTLFEKQEVLTRTELIEILLNAQEAVFTITFRKKVTPEDVQEVLGSVKSDADLKKH